MMGQQRALMDKTMRQGQGNGDPKDGGAQGLAKQQDQAAPEAQPGDAEIGPKRGEAWAKPARRWSRRRNR